jgi:hypothetical protein
MTSITVQPIHMSPALVGDTFEPFNPQAYLQEYYRHLGEENRALLHFLNDAYACIFIEKSSARILEFGGGPTIYQLISAAKYAVSIDFSDYLDANLWEVQCWLQNQPGMFGWEDYLQYVLDQEGGPSDGHAREQRAQLIRTKVRRLLTCDAKQADPLGAAYRAHYDIVSVNFVLESITTEMAEWDQLIVNAASLVGPDGYLLMCAITGATSYRVGDRFFPAVPISRDLLESKLQQQHFLVLRSHEIEAEQHERQGYDGICMVLARKRAAD